MILRPLRISNAVRNDNERILLSVTTLLLTRDYCNTSLSLTVCVTRGARAMTDTPRSPRWHYCPHSAHCNARGKRVRGLRARGLHGCIDCAQHTDAREHSAVQSHSNGADRLGVDNKGEDEGACAGRGEGGGLPCKPVEECHALESVVRPSRVQPTESRARGAGSHEMQEGRAPVQRARGATSAHRYFYLLGSKCEGTRCGVTA